jgi:hypothetical protein
VHNDVPGNLAARVRQARGNYAEAAKRAHLVIKRRFYYDRGTSSPMTSPFRSFPTTKNPPAPKGTRGLASTRVLRVLALHKKELQRVDRSADAGNRCRVGSKDRYQGAQRGRVSANAGGRSRS